MNATLSKKSPSRAPHRRRHRSHHAQHPRARLPALLQLRGGNHLPCRPAPRPAWGAAAGGIGASLADLILGYPLWAPFTLIIKGAEGYVTGKIGKRSPLLGIAAGAAVMIAGYTTMAGVLYGWAAAPVELVTDLVQCGMGAALALAALNPSGKPFPGTPETGDNKLLELPDDMPVLLFREAVHGGFTAPGHPVHRTG